MTRTTPARWLALLLSTHLVAACGESPTEPVLRDLADGDYVITLGSPIIRDPLVTPLWMGYSPLIEFTKSGDVLTVTGSTMDLVAQGPALGFAAEEDVWGARFSWSRLLDGEHYWEIRLTSGGCVTAEAVDADLGYGPNGIWRVPYRDCVVSGP